jgi:hypothetical protein
MDFGIMQHDTVIINKITADEGFVLTNGQGVYSKEIYLGKNDSPINWWEITEYEYEQILKEEEEKF